MDKYIDALTNNFINQQPIVSLMHEYIKQASGPTYNEPTMQYELANKPRYDITGDRYGTTLTDDMISIKNPRDINRHTDRTIEYFANPKGYAGEGAYVKPTYDLAGVEGSYSYQNEGDRPIGRKKSVTDGGSGVETGDDVWETLDAPGEVISYYDALRNLAQTRQLSTEGALEEKFGRAPSRQDPRYDANWDYYTESLVNYDRLSRPQLMELAKMGVNRPIEGEDDASADLMGLVNLYRRVLGLK